MPLLVAPRMNIQRYNVGPLNLFRRGPKTKNGRGGYDTPTATLINVNPIAAHPVTGKKLEQLPEKWRNSSVVKFYTEVRLYVSSGGRFTDTIAYQGGTYLIVEVRDLELQGGAFISLGVLEDSQVQP